MRTLADGAVELHVDRCFFLEIVFRVRGFHGADDPGQKRLVGFRGAPGGKLDCDAFHLAPVLEVIKRRFLVSADQFHDRPGENLANNVGDEGPAAVLRIEQAAAFENLERLPQDRPRHIELLGQFALARKPVADPQDTLEHEDLDLVNHFIGGPAVLNSCENVCGH